MAYAGATYKKSVPGFRLTPDAAISGHNKEQLSSVTPQECATACMERRWCASFDYYKNEAKCDLSDSKVNNHTIRLKEDYPGNPYDHYEKFNVVGSYTKQANAAIPGHNAKHLSDVTVTGCALACDAESWCLSFDYYKRELACGLSRASVATVPLKVDYENAPYDHYYTVPANNYKKTDNAAISGHNIHQLSGVTPHQCAAECDSQGWCTSFDYYKNESKCDLSDKTAGEVGGLKRDYPGNPYDHYQR